MRAACVPGGGSASGAWSSASGAVFLARTRCSRAISRSLAASCRRRSETRATSWPCDNAVTSDSGSTAFFHHRRRWFATQSWLFLGGVSLCLSPSPQPSPSRGEGVDMQGRGNEHPLPLLRTCEVHWVAGRAEGASTSPFQGYAQHERPPFTLSVAPAKSKGLSVHPERSASEVEGPGMTRRVG